jgi:hypothetical protein
LRILNTPTAGTASGYFDDISKAAAAAAKWSGRAPAVYVTLNPVNCALLARASNRLVERAKSATSDSDILGRRWFLMDFDPVRPAGISSTDAEHDFAIKKASECRDYLSSIGWPSPVEADSGNGAHLLFAINLPNDQAAASLLERCLKALAFQFSDNAIVVDCTTFNAARICKVYGTLSCKGDDTPDRPHRRSCLLRVPEQIIKVPRDLLEALAAQLPKEPKPSNNCHAPGTGKPFDLERWISEHGLPVVSSGSWKEGGYRWILNPCPWNSDHDNRAAFIVRWPSGVIGAGCHHNGCADKDWHALRDLYEPGWSDARYIPDGQRDENKASPELRVEIFTGADLARMELPEPKFAVDGVLPEGMSLLAGKPKLGKSWLGLNIAVAVATGGVALGSIKVELGDVLYLALEDTTRRLKTRLDRISTAQHTACPERLHLARTWPRQDKGGLAAVVEWLMDHREARLVVIDTWQKFRPPKRPKGDSYEEDYQHASELKALADRFKVAVVAVAHCRKMGAADPLEEVSGSIGLTGAADGVLVMRRERGQHDATLFVTGRDIEEQELALHWDPQFCLWSILGSADEYRMSKQRREVIKVFQDIGRPAKPAEVAKLLQKKVGAVQYLVQVLAKEGKLKVLGNGEYALSTY